MIFEDILKNIDSPEFQSLKPMQHDVLEQYEGCLKDMCPDIAIEMPTGTGKTLASLLIAEYHRRQGQQVTILTGTKQLANQVKENVDWLGIDATVFEGPGSNWSRREMGRHKRAETIGIMNYWAYININPKPEPANILILYDAHLAENAISNLYSLSIRRADHEELYFNIIKRIKSINPSRYTTVSDILNNLLVDAPLLLPFSDWHK